MIDRLSFSLSGIMALAALAGCEGPCCDPPSAPVELVLREIVLAGEPLAGVVTDPSGNAWTSRFRGDGYKITPDGATELLDSPIRLGADRVDIDRDAVGDPIFSVWYRGVAIVHAAESPLAYTVFDGTTDCLPSARATVVRGEPDGSILVGIARSDGIARLFPDNPAGPCPRWTSQNTPMSLGPGIEDGDGWIGGISEELSGEHWVGVSDDALYRWRDGGTPNDPNDDEWTAFRNADHPELSTLRFPHIARGPDGSVWVATPDGLIVIRDETWTSAPELMSPNVSHVDFGPNGFAWVSTGSGISVLSTGTLQEMAQYSTFSGLPDASVTGVAFDPSGELAYVATASGLAIMERID